MLYDKIISIIFASPACLRDGRIVISRSRDMPWRGKVISDMYRFKELTRRQSLIADRKTWDSIPPKFRPFDKDLPMQESRQTIVITDEDFRVNDPRVVVAHSFEEAVQAAKSNIVWVIGRANTYAMALPHADYMHWAKIDQDLNGNTFFPPYNPKEWERTLQQHLYIWRTSAKKDLMDFSYTIFRRKM